MLTGLAVQQVVERALPGGKMPGIAALLCGLCVLSVLARELFASLIAVRESLKPMPRLIDAFVTMIFGGAMLCAATRSTDPSFGWWLAWPLVAYAAWLFVVFALRHATGAVDAANAMIQDRMVATALSGILTGIVWSLHIAVGLRAWLLVAVFLAAAVYDLRAEARVLT